MSDAAPFRRLSRTEEEEAALAQVGAGPATAARGQAELAAAEARAVAPLDRAVQVEEVEEREAARLPVKPERAAPVDKPARRQEEEAGPPAPPARAAQARAVPGDEAALEAEAAPAEPAALAAKVERAAAKVAMAVRATAASARRADRTARARLVARGCGAARVGPCGSTRGLTQGDARPCVP